MKVDIHIFFDDIVSKSQEILLFMEYVYFRDSNDKSVNFLVVLNIKSVLYTLLTKPLGVLHNNYDTVCVHDIYINVRYHKFICYILTKSNTKF